MTNQQVSHAPAPVAAVSVGAVTRYLFPGQTMRIGRDAGCDLVVDDPLISRMHASITADLGGQIMLEDQRSANGTFAGTDRVRQARVVGDAKFALGATSGVVLSVIFNKSARPTQPPAPPMRPTHPQPLAPFPPTPAAGPRPYPTAQPSPYLPAGGPPPAQHFAGGQPRPAPAPMPQPGLYQATQLPPGQLQHPASGAPQVLVSSGQMARKHEVTIGRAADNTIVLDDPLVSRHHARLIPVPNGYQVIDLNSLNGLQLNGRRLQSGEIFDFDDRLSIGRTTLQIVNGQIVAAAAQQGAALIANGLTFALKSGKQLLQDVSFAVPPANLVAVIGPSGAGKSTMLRAITGSQPATQGEVIYQGLDLYRNFASLRQVIGVVPQDDVVHRQLTVRQALNYAAELRLPDDYDQAGRDAEVQRVVTDLGLTQHQDTLISKLSGGQRKRTSVAMELLTQPQLLLLDEPTSGLDPGLDLDVMKLLRSQADGGRTVLVVTHSTDNLDLCDQVLILAPGGLVAYYGPPAGVLGYFGFDRYAEVFKSLSADPPAHGQRWAQLNQTPLPPPALPAQGVDLSPPKQKALRQWSTLIRRQLRIIFSDRSYALATLLLPLVIAAMTLVIPGDTGFGQPDSVEGASEPSQLLVIITVGAAFMGMSASIRELISERAIFLRERTVGLSPAIYLFAKVCVLFAMTLLQSGLLIGVVRLGKAGPDTALWAPNGSIELWLAAFGTAFASALLGLLMSALVGTGEQTMPVLVITIMAQLVFCGGLVKITDRGALEAIAAIFPSRWGFAQSAATIDLTNLNPAVAQDPLWEHTLSAWTNGALALGAIGAVCLILTAVKLYRQPSRT